MGFLPANFRLPLSFCSWLRSGTGQTDRQRPSTLNVPTLWGGSIITVYTVETERQCSQNYRPAVRHSESATAPSSRWRGPQSIDPENFVELRPQRFELYRRTRKTKVSGNHRMLSVTGITKDLVTGIAVRSPPHLRRSTRSDRESETT